MTQYEPVRLRTSDDGKVYKLRDVWSYGVGENRSHLVTCQYAVKQPDGRDAWYDCKEGVMFDDIEPYEPIDRAKAIERAKDFGVFPDDEWTIQDCLNVPRLFAACKGDEYLDPTKHRNMLGVA